MQKIAVLFLVFLFLAACSGIQNTSSWIIEDSNSTITLFNAGTEITLTNDSIFFKNKSISNRFPVVMNESRIAIDGGYSRWLFSKESTNGNMTLTELFNEKPMVIKLKRIDNPKIKRL